MRSGARFQAGTRYDDRDEVIRPRLTAFEVQTKPVADYYEAKAG
jgi:adenylate kinase family enzyme